MAVLFRYFFAGSYSSGPSPTIKILSSLLRANIKHLLLPLYFDKNMVQAIVSGVFIINIDHQALKFMMDIKEPLP